MTKFLSSAYGPPWTGINGTGVTATGKDLRNSPHVYIVAVDPRVIPLHTRMTINPNPFNAAAVFQAEDTGSAIKGNRVDFYDWRGRTSQYGWGMRTVDVNFIGKGQDPINPAPANVGPGNLPERPAVIGDPHNAGGTVTDYSYVLRYSATNIRKLGYYLTDAGNAIRRLGRS